MNFYLLLMESIESQGYKSKSFDTDMDEETLLPMFIISVSAILHFILLIPAILMYRAE